MKPWEMMLRFGQGVGGGGGGDPYWANVVSLLHFDGADDSAIVDVKGKTWTPSGNAAIKSSAAIFGTAGLLLDGSGDYVSCASSPDFAFGLSDFTVEGWFKTTSPSTQYLFSFGPGWIVYVSSGVLIFNISGSNKITVSSSISGNIYIALTRSGSIVRLFKDGKLLGSYTDTPTNISAAQFNIGRYASDAVNMFNGNVDEFRITKGVARYTASFTPPSAPFPDS